MSMGTSEVVTVVGEGGVVTKSVVVTHEEAAPFPTMEATEQNATLLGFDTIEQMQAAQRAAVERLEREDKRFEAELADRYGAEPGYEPLDFKAHYDAEADERMVQPSDLVGADGTRAKVTPLGVEAAYTNWARVPMVLNGQGYETRPVPGVDYLSAHADDCGCGHCEFSKPAHGTVGAHLDELQQHIDALREGIREDWQNHVDNMARGVADCLYWVSDQILGAGMRINLRVNRRQAEQKRGL